MNNVSFCSAADFLWGKGECALQPPPLFLGIMPLVWFSLSSTALASLSLLPKRGIYNVIYYYWMCHLTSINIKLIRTLYFPSQNWINNFMLCQRYISLVCFHFFQHHRLKRDKFDCNTHRDIKKEKNSFLKNRLRERNKRFHTNKYRHRYVNKQSRGGGQTLRGGGG